MGVTKAECTSSLRSVPTRRNYGLEIGINLRELKNFSWMIEKTLELSPVENSHSS